jgi:hypothetical protein
MPDYREERAFRLDSFPCNSLPFLRRVGELLGEQRTNSLESARDNLDVRACMLILNQQLFGQLARVDLSHEWDYLNQNIEGKGEHDTAGASKFG